MTNISGFERAILEIIATNGPGDYDPDTVRAVAVAVRIYIRELEREIEHLRDPRSREEH